MHPGGPPYTEHDLAFSPLMFYYEVTRACDLVCKHCRAEASSHRDPRELSSRRSSELIDQIATFPRRPTLVFTGGDPLKRADIYGLIEHARRQGLEVALTPSATPLATHDALTRAHEAGVSCLGVSLDGASAATHDAFRGWSGSFDRTLAVLGAARDLGLAVQVNTSVCQRNFAELEALATLLVNQGIVMWSVFFLVPVGRGETEPRLTPPQYELAFAKLHRIGQQSPYKIKTTEAPHYRRFVLEARRTSDLRPAPTFERNSPDRVRFGIGDGKGIQFVSHTGGIYPAGFLPVQCGQFPHDSVVETYQRHQLFCSLRDADQLGGKCGRCPYRHICGGSRSRAYAVTGDPLAEEPDCVFGAAG